jgi:hypothetical protein
MGDSDSLRKKLKALSLKHFSEMNKDDLSEHELEKELEEHSKRLDAFFEEPEIHDLLIDLLTGPSGRKGKMGGTEEEGAPESIKINDMETAKRITEKRSEQGAEGSEKDTLKIDAAEYGFRSKEITLKLGKTSSAMPQCKCGYKGKVYFCATALLGEKNVNYWSVHDIHICPRCMAATFFGFH